MKKTSLAIIALSLLIPLLVLSFILTLPRDNDQNKINLQPSQECNVISYNGEDKINLVFFASKEESLLFSEELLKFSPLNKNKEAFNIYYISPDQYKPECELYKEIALLCYSKEIIKTASICPNDYIVTIKSQPANIRSSAYMNTISINSNLPKTVIAHEFGHVFANLAEEYTPATIPKGSQNCAQNCDDFNLTNQCFQGCSKTDYFRSIDQGIMKTLSSKNFGTFNEVLILEQIKKQSSKQNKIFTSKAIQEVGNCLSQQYYLINANYSDGKITINEKTIQNGCVGNSGTGEFILTLEKNDGSLIDLTKFNPELIFTDSQNESENQISGTTFYSDKEFYLKVPIIPQSNSINIIKNNTIIISVNINEIGRQLCIN